MKYQDQEVICLTGVVIMSMQLEAGLDKNAVQGNREPRNRTSSHFPHSIHIFPLPLATICDATCIHVLIQGAHLYLLLQVSAFPALRPSFTFCLTFHPLMLWVEQCLTTVYMLKSQPPLPQNGTLFGNHVYSFNIVFKQKCFLLPCAIFLIR